MLTARFGEYGLWANYHTGLDFNGENGDPIHAIANGVVTFAGYDGSYGNKTVVTLEDGTEIWYCHQTDQYVSVGDVVTGDELIGTVGSTGHVTGSHLHIEVRPGGGDPVDPYAAFIANGVQLPSRRPRTGCLLGPGPCSGPGRCGVGVSARWVGGVLRSLPEEGALRGPTTGTRG